MNTITACLKTLCHPKNTSTSVTDCAPADATKWRTATTYTDADGDTYGVGAPTSTCYGNTLPANTALNNTDCNDASATTWQNLTCYVDADGDGWTVGAAATQCKGTACNSPAGHSATTAGEDCNDADPTLTNNCYAQAYYYGQPYYHGQAYYYGQPYYYAQPYYYGQAYYYQQGWYYGEPGYQCYTCGIK